jgi:hypothetical protein
MVVADRQTPLAATNIQRPNRSL